LAFINGVRARVAESGFGLIPGFPYTAPFEDLALMGGSMIVSVNLLVDIVYAVIDPCIRLEK
jgi:hypothetical protein